MFGFFIFSVSIFLPIFTFKVNIWLSVSKANVKNNFENISFKLHNIGNKTSYKRTNYMGVFAKNERGYRLTLKNYR